MPVVIGLALDLTEPALEQHPRRDCLLLTAVIWLVLRLIALQIEPPLAIACRSTVYSNSLPLEPTERELESVGRDEQKLENS